MNHPVLNFGYLIEADGQKVFFTGDHEPLQNIYEPDDAEYGEYQELIALRNDSIEEWLKDVDLLITDSMYTSEEYPSKVGWGHGSFDACIQMATRACANHLVLTHHDPCRTDAQLEAISHQLPRDLWSLEYETYGRPRRHGDRLRIGSLIVRTFRLLQVHRMIVDKRRGGTVPRVHVYVSGDMWH